MHNIISRRNLVALLKCVSLHPYQIWDKYAIGQYVLAQIASFIPKR